MEGSHRLKHWLLTLRCNCAASDIVHVGLISVSCMLNSNLIFCYKLYANTVLHYDFICIS